MTRVNAYASWPHYIDHLAPIWNELSEEEKGQFLVPSKGLQAHAESVGVKADMVRQNGTIAPSWASREPVMVAGYVDLRKQHRRPVALVEHGAGQTYIRDDGTIHGGYSGGRNRSKAGLFICPSTTVADRNHKTYPNATSVAVGCPRLDDLLAARQTRHDDTGLNIGISFHWDCAIVPESGSAFGEFKEQIEEFVSWARLCGFNILGHGHPKAWPFLYGWWSDMGVTPVKEWSEVAAVADVYIIDNSSTMFEAAALDIPVVVLESGKWRKGVDHGLRFWEHANIGPTVLAGDSLSDAVEESYSSYWKKKRAEVSSQVYEILPSLSRLSSITAATAVRQWVRDLDKE